MYKNKGITPSDKDKNEMLYNNKFINNDDVGKEFICRERDI